MAQQRTRLFVSYSHHDRRWFERLTVHLRPLIRNDTIDVWDDTRIQHGAKWREEIVRGLSQAKIAVLLVSADFLGSDYITEHELPKLLEAARDEGATILPVIVSPSRYARTVDLGQFQAANDPARPLNSLTESEQEAVFEKVAEDVERLVGQQELRAKYNVLSGQLDQQQRQLEAQQVLINELVTYMLSAPIFRHLCGIALLKEYNFGDGPMSRELYFLRDIGFIKPKNGDFVPFDARLNETNLQSAGTDADKMVVRQAAKKRSAARIGCATTSVIIYEPTSRPTGASRRRFGNRVWNDDCATAECPVRRRDFRLVGHDNKNSWTRQLFGLPGRVSPAS